MITKKAGYRPFLSLCLALPAINDISQEYVTEPIHEERIERRHSHSSALLRSLVSPRDRTKSPDQSPKTSQT